MPPPNELSISFIISSTCSSTKTSDICEGPVGGPTFEFNLFSGVHRSLWTSGTSPGPKPQPVLAALLTLPASCGHHRVHFVSGFLNSSLAFVLSSCSSFILCSVSSFCFVSSPLTSLSTFLTSSFVVLTTVFTDPNPSKSSFATFVIRSSIFRFVISFHFLFRVIVHLPHDLNQHLYPLSDRSCISDLDRPTVFFCIFGTSWGPTMSSSICIIQKRLRRIHSGGCISRGSRQGQKTVLYLCVFFHGNQGFDQIRQPSARKTLALDGAPRASSSHAKTPNGFEDPLSINTNITDREVSHTPPSQQEWQDSVARNSTRNSQTSLSENG